MKKLAAGLMAIALVMILTVVTVGSVTASTTLVVDDDGVECPGAYLTIEAALSAAADGDTILVCPGSYAGVLVDKSVEIRGAGGASIDDGPLHPAGLTYGFRMDAGSDGSTISHLRFTTDLAIMNGEAVDDVTVTHNTFEDTIQGVSNWRGSGWNISHNQFTDLRTRSGGGIAILVADFSGGIVRDNVVSHNKISGTLHVAATDGGGYDGTGIALFADFRWGRAGAEAITANRVVKNRISLTSDNPEVVGVHAMELTDTRDDEGLASAIYGNVVGFNDVRGTESGILLTPENLGDVNDISRNLGDDRGHGLHPGLFGPGGN